VEELTATLRDGRRVVVAGSGVGAVEAVLALRALAGEQVEIELVADETELEYRPLAVVEPFGYPQPAPLPLDRLEQTHGVRLRRDGLARVEARGHRVTLLGGDELEFDALVVATGARPQQWLPGALTFGGRSDVGGYRALLADLEAGSVTRVLFAVPARASWTLPLYELALLTAAWLAEHGVIGAELSLATPTAEPLELFGPGAAGIVRNLLGDRGIQLLTGAQVGSLRDDRTALVGSTPVATDRVVTLPRLVAEPRRVFPAALTGSCRPMNTARSLV
jgi:sulfide:quinone oxidoreductase